MKKKDKVDFIQAHIASMLVDNTENDAIPASNVVTSDDNDSSESWDSDGDEVIRATATLDEMQEGTHEDEDSFQAENLFRETKCGRVATSWRRYQFQ